jgi:hypothetical protein
LNRFEAGGEVRILRRDRERGQFFFQQKARDPKARVLPLAWARGGQFFGVVMMMGLKCHGKNDILGWLKESLRMSCRA